MKPDFKPGGIVPSVESWYVLRSLTVWVVGSYDDQTWQLQGVYSEQKLAEQHARAGWFVGPVEFNTPLPEDTTEWPDAYIVEEDGLAV